MCVVCECGVCVVCMCGVCVGCVCGGGVCGMCGVCGVCVCVRAPRCSGKEEFLLRGGCCGCCSSRK